MYVGSILEGERVVIISVLQPKLRNKQEHQEPSWGPEI